MTPNPIAVSGWFAAGVLSLVMVAVVVVVLRMSRRIRGAGGRWAVAITAFASVVLVSGWAVSRLAAAFIVARGVITVPPRSDVFVHLNPIIGLLPALIAVSVGIWYLVRSRRSADPA